VLLAVELAQALVADAEVVGDLMQDDPPDLVPEDDGIRAVATLEWAREVQAQIVPLLLPSAAAANALAVASDVVGTVGIDEVAPGAAGDRVACAVVGAHDIAAGPGGHPVSSASADEDVVAA
jgi:hypothetical protein